ncbi:hypothetical protein MAPG_05979 [Magnaporthiopsis poae ATCC 64411]|uniref:Uncharacterized protein n=1 Tax=Magnaporthiopsis poae (strain ATCC 64411 / 73-15) TaxID=644358 RepID=A0A0C4E0U2_MAGP6|nr:hypothetical protein MAPG_05979 [Magnaporthiopsis poae ATCC 64411]
MQLWSAICLAGLALAAPAEPNGAGTLVARGPLLLMPGQPVTHPACPDHKFDCAHPRLSKASRKMPKRSEDALEKREPILLPNHPSVTGGESAAAAGEQAASVEKREPKRGRGKLGMHATAGGRQIKALNGEIIPWGPQRRDVVDGQAAEVKKRFISISKPLHGIAPAYRRIRGSRF